MLVMIALADGGGRRYDIIVNNIVPCVGVEERNNISSAEVRTSLPTDASALSRKSSRKIRSC